MSNLGEMTPHLFSLPVKFTTILPDLAMLHHDGEEPDDNLGAGPEEHLPLTPLLS